MSKNMLISFRNAELIAVAFLMLIPLTDLHAQSWTELGTGVNALKPNNNINHVACDAAGNIYAAGHFTNAGGKYYVAKWNGTNWSELGNTTSLGSTTGLYNVHVGSSGNIYSAYQGDSRQNVAKLTGTNWTEVGTGGALDCPHATELVLASDASGRIYTDYAFDAYDFNLAVNNAGAWGFSLVHLNGAINCILPDGAGNVYAAGAFSDMSSDPFVAKWNGTTWNQVGTGANAIEHASTLESIYTLAKDPSGNIYAAGEIRNSTGYMYVAKWNGTNWFSLGSGGSELRANDNIMAVIADNSGHVYAAGDFRNASGWRYVAKWDGSSWSELGGVNAFKANGKINSLAIDAAGNIYAAGEFVNADGYRYVAKYGTSASAGITDITEEKSSLQLYPNPSSDIFTIEGAGQLTITDMTGRQVYKAAVNTRQTLSTAKWADGIYFCTLQGIKGTDVARLIVSH